MPIKTIILYYFLMISVVCHAGEWARINGTTISFTGTIEIDELRRFQEIYKPTDEAIILNSGGGRMDAALDIGSLLIKNKKLTAIVRGICASSCANYFFLAAKNKVIDRGIVGFHGNWKTMINKEEFNKHMAELEPDKRVSLLDFHRQHVKKETAFISNIGVSQELFERTQKENDAGLYEVYLPGPSIFKKYGIENVKGYQDLDRIKGLKLLYDNGLHDNNSEDLKNIFRNEFQSATEKRKDEIRILLAYLNKQFPLQTTSNSMVPRSDKDSFSSYRVR